MMKFDPDTHELYGYSGYSDGATPAGRGLFFALPREVDVFVKMFDGPMHLTYVPMSPASKQDLYNVLGLRVSGENPLQDFLDRLSAPEYDMFCETVAKPAAVAAKWQSFNSIYDG